MLIFFGWLKTWFFFENFILGRKAIWSNLGSIELMNRHFGWMNLTKPMSLTESTNLIEFWNFYSTEFDWITTVEVISSIEPISSI